jgi:hypothetical protein
MEYAIVDLGSARSLDQGDPLAAGLDGYGCAPCVGHEVAIGVHLSTHLDTIA